MESLPKWIIRYPNGDIDRENLAELLFRAHVSRRKQTDKIKILVHQRVAEFCPQSPEYETVEEEKDLKELKSLYKKITGVEFNPKADDFHAIRPVYLILFSRQRGAVILDIGL